MSSNYVSKDKSRRPPLFIRFIDHRRFRENKPQIVKVYKACSFQRVVGSENGSSMKCDQNNVISRYLKVWLGSSLHQLFVNIFRLGAPSALDLYMLMGRSVEGTQKYSPASTEGSEFWLMAFWTFVLGDFRRYCWVSKIRWRPTSIRWKSSEILNSYRCSLQSNLGTSGINFTTPYIFITAYSFRRYKHDLHIQHVYSIQQLWNVVR